MMLGSKEILRLIKEENMITDYINLDKQLQPNGFDLTVAEIFEVGQSGILKEGRKVSLRIEKKNSYCMPVMNKRYFVFAKGAYLVKFNEIIQLPKNISAITIQRSSLMRMLVHTQVGSWDVGYHGRGFSMLIVNNPNGVKIEENVRIVQMHFFKTTEVLKKYDGSYQKENLTTHERTET